MLVTLHSQANATVRFEACELRITGGVLWNPVEQGIIGHYSDGGWRHRGESFARISVLGGCCLLFGITRDPSLLSDPLEMFSFNGPTFYAAGYPIARFIEPQEVWQGLIRPIWWSSMRIISTATVSALVSPSRVELLNPWQPVAQETSDPAHRPGLASESVNRWNEPSRSTSPPGSRIG